MNAIDKSYMRDERLKRIITLLQEKPMTKIEISKEVKVTLSVVSVDLMILRKEIAIDSKIEKGKMFSYKINEPVDTDKLLTFQRQKVGQVQGKAKFETIKTKLDEEIVCVHKDKIHRPELLNWLCTNFIRDTDATMGQIRNYLKSKGVKVVS